MEKPKLEGLVLCRVTLPSSEPQFPCVQLEEEARLAGLLIPGICGYAEENYLHSLVQVCAFFWMRMCNFEIIKEPHERTK